MVTIHCTPQKAFFSAVLFVFDVFLAALFKPITQSHNTTTEQTIINTVIIIIIIIIIIVINSYY
jgi:uncharacterized membrane protein